VTELGQKKAKAWLVVTSTCCEICKFGVVTLRSLSMVFTLDVVSGKRSMMFAALVRSRTNAARLLVPDVLEPSHGGGRQ
jgi:hypothetical protein